MFIQIDQIVSILLIIVIIIIIIMIIFENYKHKNKMDEEQARSSSKIRQSK